MSRNSKAGCVTALLTALALGGHATAEGTWSVIAADLKTREVAIASATCVRQAAFARFPAKGLMDVQAIVVPGKGVAAAQAGVDRTRRNQRLIYEELRKGTDPEAILDRVKQDMDIARRQFGIVDVAGRSAGFSGGANGRASVDVQGAVADIVFSVQGNILAGNHVAHNAARVFRETSGGLLDRVMAAMEAADEAGGDRRCTCETEPLTQAPCDAKTSHVAYVLLAKPENPVGESHNDGKYSVYLSVTDHDVKPEENANPIKTLRMRYTAWKRSVTSGDQASR